MAHSHKYGKVTLERSTIGENEPVVVFRAKDKLLPQVLAHCHLLCLNSGCEDQHLTAIVERHKEIKDWQSKNTSKLPDTTKEQWNGS
jgi:hypothetical protein